MVVSSLGHGLSRHVCTSRAPAGCTDTLAASLSSVEDRLHHLELAATQRGGWPAAVINVSLLAEPSAAQLMPGQLPAHRVSLALGPLGTARSKLRRGASRAALLAGTVSSIRGRSVSDWEVDIQGSLDEGSTTAGERNVRGGRSFRADGDTTAGERSVRGGRAFRADGSMPAVERTLSGTLVL
jgi:hypothetical protein